MSLFTRNVQLHKGLMLASWSEVCAPFRNRKAKYAPHLIPNAVLENQVQDIVAPTQSVVAALIHWCLQGSHDSSLEQLGPNFCRNDVVQIGYIVIACVSQKQSRMQPPHQGCPHIAGLSGSNKLWASASSFYPYQQGMGMW